MPLTITNNISSLIAQENLGASNNALATSLQRLSSGLKINSAADGPAALVISQEHQAQISGLQAAIDNTSKAVDVAQTAEGALGEVNTLLLKIRSLAVDSANAGVNDGTSLAANQAEIANALDTINRIATSTHFGTKLLLDGSQSATNATVIGSGTTAPVVSQSASNGAALGTYTVKITTAATAASATGTIDLSATNVLAAGETETLTVNGVKITLQGGQNGLTAGNAIDQINSFSDQTGVTAAFDSTGKDLQLTANTLGSGNKFTLATTGPVKADGTAGADGTGLAGATVTDGKDVVADVTAPGAASAVSVTGQGSNLSSNGLTVTFGASAAVGNQATIQVANDAMVFQIGANAGDTATLSINRAAADALGQGVSTKFASLNGVNVINPSNTTDVLAVVDKAIADVSTLRGTLGAFQTNTLEATANTLQTMLTNTTAAESTITSTDFAAETASFTKNQVLVQAGTQVLKNANATSQLVLSLLQ